MGRPKAAARGGFTLLELMLVLAILLAVAALAWPVLSRAMAVERLRKAADRVHAEWVRAEALVAHHVVGATTILDKD